jgi:transcriptional regulator with XRE-family HTH domain
MATHDADHEKIICSFLSLTFLDRKRKDSMKKEMRIETVGERIRLLRKQKNMTQEQLAEKLHLENKSSVSCYENNRRGISGDMARLIAGIFDTTVDYILNGDVETTDEYTMQVVKIMAQIKSKEAKKIAVKHLLLVVEMENT